MIFIFIFYASQKHLYVSRVFKDWDHHNDAVLYCKDSQVLTMSLPKLVFLYYLFIFYTCISNL